MTQKQIAERLGVDARRLDYEFQGKCRRCSRTGGKSKPCGECRPLVMVTLKEAAK